MLTHRFCRTLFNRSVLPFKRERIIIAAVPCRGPSSVNQIRFYARQSARRTKVEEQEQQTEQQTNPLQGYKNTTTEQRHTYYQPTTEEEGSTESALTPDIRAYLAKVYGTMMAGFGLAAGGAVAGIMAPVLAMPAMIASFIGVIALSFMDRSKVTTRQNLFLGVGGLMGMSIAPLIAMSAPGVVFAAALGTSAIFAGFTLTALKAKRKSMLMLGGPLLGGLFLIVGCSLASILLPMLGVTSPALLGALYNVNLYGGLAIFSLFISYDTQMMIEGYKEGNRDHVQPALSMFLNLFNIFVRLLAIFGGRND